MSQKKHLLCFAVLKGKGCSEHLFVKKKLTLIKTQEPQEANPAIFIIPDSVSCLSCAFMAITCITAVGPMPELKYNASFIYTQKTIMLSFSGNA